MYINNRAQGKTSEHNLLLGGSKERFSQYLLSVSQETLKWTKNGTGSMFTHIKEAYVFRYYVVCTLLAKCYKVYGLFFFFSQLLDHTAQ